MREKCAMVGVETTNGEIDAAKVAFLALESLQHRGDAASGSASPPKTMREFQHHADPGLVKDVYASDLLANLVRPSAIGRNRHPTSCVGEVHSQPAGDGVLGLVLGHNGNFSV